MKDMRIQYNIRRPILVVCLTLAIFPLIQGCWVSFPTTELEEIDYVEVDKECQNKPRVSFNIEFNNDSPRHGYTEDHMNERKNLLKKSFIETGAFESVQEDDADADIHVNVVHTFVYRPGWADGVSGATLGIIPTVDSHGVEIKGRILKDDESISFYYYDEINTATWILLLPVLLFRDEDQAGKDVAYYRYKMIVSQIQQLGRWSCLS